MTNPPPLPLAADPKSVREARLWVAQALTRIERPDLLEAAELGVSELVTNAILHGRPPIDIRLRGTLTHPRVEVHDSSAEPPRLPSEPGKVVDSLLSTVGRGLGIVSMFSAACGVDVTSAGKVVWFEPASGSAADPAGATVSDLRGSFVLAAPSPVVVPSPVQRFPVELLSMPVRLFVEWRTWYDELRRELRLLSMHHSEQYPAAAKVTDLAADIEGHRRQITGSEALDQAVRRGTPEQLDVTFNVPLDLPPLLAQLNDAMREADRFCREEKLLAVAGTPEQITFREWYLGELVVQPEGVPPTAWPDFRALAR